MHGGYFSANTMDTTYLGLERAIDVQLLQNNDVIALAGVMNGNAEKNYEVRCLAVSLHLNFVGFSGEPTPLALINFARAAAEKYKWRPFRVIAGPPRAFAVQLQGKKFLGVVAWNKLFQKWKWVSADTVPLTRHRRSKSLCLRGFVQA
jgi:hypothetical protein